MNFAFHTDAGADVCFVSQYGTKSFSPLTKSSIQGKDATPSES